MELKLLVSLSLHSLKFFHNIAQSPAQAHTIQQITQKPTFFCFCMPFIPLYFVYVFTWTKSKNTFFGCKENKNHKFQFIYLAIGPNEIQIK